MASRDAIIATHNEKLTTLENEKQNLQRELARIESVILEVQHDRDQFINETAPIASLPNELLAYVFQLCHISQPTIYDSLTTARDLSRVTAHWRTVAISMPHLWSSIYLTEELPPDILSIYLQRSGTCLLDLIVWHLHPTHTTVPMWQAIRSKAAQLVPLAGRWRSLHMHAGFTLVADILGTLCVPRLESLHLDLTDAPLTDHNRLLAGGAPSLRLVHFRTIGPPLISFPSATVTRLWLQDLRPLVRLDAHAFRALVQSLPALAELVVCSSSLRPSTSVPPPISLPELAVLQIHGPTELADRLLFLSVSAPRLHTLVVKAGIDVAATQVAPMTCRLARNYPALRTFVSVDNAPHAVDLLGGLPSVEHFVHVLPEGEQIERTEALFPRLRGSPLPLPGLRKLTLAPLEDLGALCSLVEYRADSEPPLLEVCIPRVYAGDEGDAVAWLRGQVKVSYRDADDTWHAFDCMASE
ncbi:hypothetical protein PLICRDRAFT_500736 [Plicaturopsis crispa FD-325 SS-3]|nr:hypothetical protein PLICRDRAFT_500736 [Plicaturopsis crispa FD-325 SS-3]